MLTEEQEDDIDERLLDCLRVLYDYRSPAKYTQMSLNESIQDYGVLTIKFIGIPSLNLPTHVTKNVNIKVA